MEYNKKKILFMIPNLRYGGAEKVLVNLVNNLNKAKYEITLYTIFDDGVNKQFLNKDINYKYKYKKVFKGNSFLIKLFSPAFLYNWFIKEKYDIVISYLEGPTTRIISGCSNKNTKKVAWVHIEFNTQKRAMIGFKNIREAKKYYNKLDAIIGVSQNVIQYVKEYITDDVPISVLYNTNETNKIKELANEAIDLQLNKDTVNIVSVAKIMPTKGFDRLLEVLYRLLNEGFKIKIYIIGIGEEQKKLEIKAKDLGVENCFTFLGFHENPYKYVSKFDIYICSSRREGFSTAVTEALILGLPVVSTNVSGAKELLGENNEFGIVTENSTEGIYEGLKEMLSDKNKREYYRNQAKLRGNLFSKEQTVNAVEYFIDNLLL